jgi:hypothetical protein
LHQSQLKRFFSEVGSNSTHITEGFSKRETYLTEAPPTWPQLIDVNKANTPGTSAQIAVIGPAKIMSLGHRNPPLVSSATSVSPNVPIKIASNERKASIAT